MKVCSCGKKAYAGSVCSACYARQRRKDPKERDKDKETAKRYRRRKLFADPDYFRKQYKKYHRRNLLTAYNNRWKKYGMTVEQYHAFTKKHGNKCGICESINTNNKLFIHFPVDHDHQTGTPRGILCNNCNRGIGYLQDSITVVEKALKYLIQSKSLIGDIRKG